MSTTEVALTDESGAVAYVDLSTVPEAPRTSHAAVGSPESVALALWALFAVLALVSMWVTVIHIVKH